MVERPGVIAPEIAREHGRSLHTVTKSWMRHPEWPPPVGKRGRYNEYDREAVAAWIAAHAARPSVELEPDRLYTAQQLEDAAIGIAASTIRADRSLGRWPAPDDESDGVARWKGSTAAATMQSRRVYRRREQEQD
jgi:hypothetical protein